MNEIRELKYTDILVKGTVGKKSIERERGSKEERDREKEVQSCHPIPRSQ